MITPSWTTALSLYEKFGACEEKDPIERLRAFCSFAMSGQDWIDVEQFFNAVIADREASVKAYKASLKPCIYVGEPSAWLKEGGAKETKDMVERLGMVPIALYRLDDQP